MSWETDYAAKKRQQEQARANTPEALRDRLAVGRANKRVRTELLERFPTLTAKNMEAAVKFQQERFEEIVAEERTTTYWKGDKARYTGQTLERYGAEFYELELLEGHRRGEKVWTPKEGL